MQVASFLHTYIWSYLHPTPSKRPNAIKLGVLVEKAGLDPVTIIYPSKTHPAIILHALSLAQSPSRQHTKHANHFVKTYTSHNTLLDDPTITAVYICAPIGARYTLAKAALAKGKHVLCESPVAGNAEAVRDVHDFARERGVVLLDGPDWQFHPATHAWRKIVDTREYGRLLRTETVVTSTSSLPSTDPAWDFESAGGAFITHSSALSATRFALHATTPSTILSSVAQRYPQDPRIDTSLTTHLLFPSPSSTSTSKSTFTSSTSNANTIHSRIHTSLSRPRTLNNLIPHFWSLPTIIVETDFALLTFSNFTHPHLYNSISVTDKRSGEVRHHSLYRGGPLWGERVVSTGTRGGSSGWSGWRWRVEAFVDVVQGRTPVFWVCGQESVWNGEGVDKVYIEAGLPVREGKGVDVYRDSEGEGDGEGERKK